MLRNRKLIVVLVIAVLLATAGFATAAMTLSAQDLLVAGLTNVEAATDGHAVVEFEATTPEMSGSGSFEVWGRLEAGPNGEPAFRMEVLSSSMPEAPVGLTAVGDGTTLWVWEPVENVVFTGSYEEIAAAAMAKMAEHEGDYGNFEPPADMPDEAEMPETPEEAVAMLLEYVTADRDGMVEIGGEDAYQVRLIPIAEQMPEEMRAIGGLVNVWIRQDDKAPLGAEFTGSAVGSAAVRVTSLAINEGVDDGVFTFTIPEGADVITVDDLEAMAASAAAEAAAAMEAATAIEFEALVPTAVPDDAVLVDELNVRGAVVQRYNRDGGSFTVAQGPVGAANVLPEGDGTAVTVRGVEGMSYVDADGGRSLLTWGENGLAFWIGGDISPEEALAVAESLE